MNKQSLARYNRWLGWLLVPAILLSVVVAYPRGNPLWDVGTGSTYWTIQGLVMVLPLLHFIATLYLFGMPRFSNGLRAWHVYIGYLTFLAIFISQSLIGADGPIQPWFDIGNAVMYLLIVVHVVLGFRSWMDRRKSSTDSMASIHRGA